MKGLILLPEVVKIVWSWYVVRVALVTVGLVPITTILGLDQGYL